MHHRISAPFALLLMLAVSACASTPDRGESRAEPPETRVRVENYYHSPVTIYVLSGGLDRRLGEVSAAQTETFTLPDQIRELDLQIVIDPLGALTTYRSRRIAYSPGDLIAVALQGNLGLTQVTVR